MTNMLDAALVYARQGWPVFPIMPGAKSPPLVSDWAEIATTNQDIIRRWWEKTPDANIGFCPERAGLCVVDFDVGHNGIIYNALPLCVKVVTPSGGRHAYFKGSLPSTAGKLSPHVDTRGRGGYVLLPPSKLENRSTEYRWASYPDHTYAHSYIPVPYFISENVEPDNPTQQPPRPPGFVEDLPGALRKAREWLRSQEPPVEFAGSDEATLKAAYQLRDFGVSDWKTIELLVQWTGFDKSWVEEKVDHAWKYAQRTEPGTKLGLDGFEPELEDIGEFVPTTGGQDDDPIPAGAKMFYSGAEQTEFEPGPVEELVEGLIEKHCVNYVSGAGGLHKSRLAQQLGLCIHAGVEPWGRAIQPAQFVHISYENGRREDARRQEKILDALGIDPVFVADTVYADWRAYNVPLIKISDAGDLEPTDAWRVLEHKLNLLHGHKFIVFDSCYQVMAFQGNSKMAENAVMQAISWLDSKMAELDATGLMLMHPSYAGIQRGDNSGFSMAWNNRPRVRLAVDAINGVLGGIEIRMVKRNNAPPWVGSVKLMYQDGALVPLSTETDNVWYECMMSLFRDELVGSMIGDARCNKAKHRQHRKRLCKMIFDRVGTGPNDDQILDLLALAKARRDLIYVEHDAAGNSGRNAHYALPPLDKISPLDG